MTGVPSSVAAQAAQAAQAEQAEQAWADEPDRTVLWLNVAGSSRIVARDGRAESFTGRQADDEADAFARRWKR